MELIYACEEHIDEAMVEVINEKENIPVINEVAEKKFIYFNNKDKYELKMM